MKTSFSVLVFILFSITIGGVVCDAPVVTTKYGPIQGTSNDMAYLYLGIPFAQPPVGGLRFEEPLRPIAWYPKVLNVTSYQPACPQPDCASRMPKASCPTAYSEDCLYLNVFVPKNETSDKAVMVFIHGGNFQYQGANTPLTDGSMIASYNDVIVVTIQYRLGALGFLVTGLEFDQLQGNFGIKDQRMALQWVYDNIENFGGDKSRITLFGQSAGAQSATIHYLSDDMQQIVNNVILQSAPMSIPFRTFEETMSIYEYFADELNCTARDVICLRSKSVDDIVSAQFYAEKKVTSLKLLDFFEPWLPWLDGTLVKGQLLEIEKWLPNNQPLKPFMLGTLTDECWIFINLAWSHSISAKEYIELMVGAFKQDALKVIGKFPPDFSSSDQKNETSALATKWVFSCSNRKFIEKAFSANRTQASSYYLYVFDYPLDFPGWDNFTFCNGYSCHGADLPYTFDVPDYEFTPNGHTLALAHMTYWTNFAKTGNPNANFDSNVKDTPMWPAYDVKTRPIIRFKSPNSVENGYLSDECDFFDSIGYYH